MSLKMSLSKICFITFPGRPVSSLLHPIFYPSGRQVRAMFAFLQSPGFSPELWSFKLSLAMTLANSLCHPWMPQTFVCPIDLSAPQLHLLLLGVMLCSLLTLLEGPSEQWAHVFLRFSLVFSASYPSPVQNGLTEDQVKLADGCLCPTQGTVFRVYDPPLFCAVCRWGVSWPQYLHWSVIFLTCTQCSATTEPHNRCCLARSDKLPASSISWISIYQSCGILLLADVLKWTKADTKNELWASNYPFTLDGVSRWLGDGTAVQDRETQGTPFLHSSDRHYACFLDKQNSSTKKSPLT